MKFLLSLWASIPGFKSANLALLFLQPCMNLHSWKEAYGIALGSFWLLVNHLSVWNSLHSDVQGSAPLKPGTQIHQGLWHDSLAPNPSHQWLPQLQRAQDKILPSYNQSKGISAMPGLTLNLLNGKVLQILGNKSTVEKDRYSPEMLSITALVNWEIVPQPVESSGKIFWVFK